jgi:hypothetical protein
MKKSDIKDELFSYKDLKEIAVDYRDTCCNNHRMFDFDNWFDFRQTCRKIINNEPTKNKMNLIIKNKIMKIELDRKGLEVLVKGSEPNYNEFEHLLIKKAGHRYNDQYGNTSWDKLSSCTDEELYNIYKICRDSWIK